RKRTATHLSAAQGRSGPPWASSCVDLLGPPVEARFRADEVGPLLEGGAAGELGVLQLLDRGEMPIDERTVDQRPEVLGGLQLRGMGRGRNSRCSVLRHAQLDARMPAGAIEDAFMLGPLYLVTGIGLLRRRSWVVPVGLVTGAMIFYADLYFIFSGTLAQHTADTTSIVPTLLSAIPYLAYPLWLVPTLLLRRAQFA